MLVMVVLLVSFLFDLIRSGAGEMEGAHLRAALHCHPVMTGSATE